MLERLTDLPEGIEGIRATGKVTQEDYDRVFEPLLREAREQGRRIRLLFELGPDVEGFTPGAAWEDAWLGMRYLRLFERCAVATDVGWLHKSARFVGALLPFPLEVFPAHGRDLAIEWLSAPETRSTVSHHLLRESGVLVVEPDRPLRSEDFDAVAMTIDPWIEQHGMLEGLVIHATAFPGWEDLGSALRHMQLVRAHHRHVRRVALAADTRLAKLVPTIAEHLVQAEVRQFGYDELDAALEWAAGSGGAGKSETKTDGGAGPSPAQPGPR